MPVDCQEALRLRTENKLQYKEIAAIQGVSKQAIHQQLKKLIPNSAMIQQYKANMADIVAHASYKGLNAYLSLTDEEQKSLVLRRGILDSAIMIDKHLLLTGQATSNVAIIHADIASLSELQRQRRGGTGQK